MTRAESPVYSGLFPVAPTPSTETVTSTSKPTSVCVNA